MRITGYFHLVYLDFIIILKFLLSNLFKINVEIERVGCWGGGEDYVEK